MIYRKQKWSIIKYHWETGIRNQSMNDTLVPLQSWMKIVICGYNRTESTLIYWCFLWVSLAQSNCFAIHNPLNKGIRTCPWQLRKFPRDYININLWDVITKPWPTFCRGLRKLPLMLGRMSYTVSIHILDIGRMSYTISIHMLDIKILKWTVFINI